MTKADIIKLAREAGLYGFRSPTNDSVSAAKRFANLVAAAEREACAKLCLETEPFYGVMFADIIRARGTT